MTVANAPKYDPMARYRIAKEFAEKAVASIVNDGQTIRARQRNALTALGCAYDRIAKMHDDVVATAARQAYPTNIPARMKELERKSLPMNLSHVREAKHKDAATLTGFWPEIHALVTMRDAVLAVDVVKFTPKDPSPEAIVKSKILQTFRELTEDQRKTFDWAAAIIRTAEEVKPGIKALPISVMHVYCSNFLGTDWVRIDWYLEGKRIPFSALMAAIDADTRVSA